MIDVIPAGSTLHLKHPAQKYSRHPIPAGPKRSPPPKNRGENWPFVRRPCSAPVHQVLVCPWLNHSLQRSELDHPHSLHNLLHCIGFRRIIFRYSLSNGREVATLECVAKYIERG